MKPNNSPPASTGSFNFATQQAAYNSGIASDVPQNAAVESEVLIQAKPGQGTSKHPLQVGQQCQKLPLPMFVESVYSLPPEISSRIWNMLTKTDQVRFKATGSVAATLGNFLDTSLVVTAGNHLGDVLDEVKTRNQELRTFSLRSPTSSPSTHSRMHNSAIVEAHARTGQPFTNEMRELALADEIVRMRIDIDDFAKLLDPHFSELQSIDLKGCTFADEQAADTAIGIIAKIAPSKVTLLELPWLKDHHLIQLADAGVKHFALQSNAGISDSVQKRLGASLELVAQTPERMNFGFRPANHQESMEFQGLVNAFMLI